MKRDRKNKEQNTDFSDNERLTFSLRSRILIIVLIIIFLTAVILAFYFQEGQYRQRIETNLVSIAELKAVDIERWLDERKGNAGTITQYQSLADDISTFMSLVDDKAIQEKLADTLTAIDNYYYYENVSLVDTGGNKLISTNGSKGLLPAFPMTQLKAAFSTGEPVMTDLYRSPEDGKIYMGIIAPIFTQHEGVTDPIAAVIMTINPQHYLYPLIQSWPVESETAEIVLVRREGDRVQVLNNLRFNEDTALNLEITLTNHSIPVQKAFTGYEGVFEGRDYRDMEVFSAVIPVHDTPWYLVAKIDKSEALSPWLIQVLTHTILMVALLAVAIVLVWLLLKRRREQVILAGYRADARVRHIEERYKTIVENSTEGIILQDAGGKIIIWNKAAERIFGLSAKEALGHTSVDREWQTIHEDGSPFPGTEHPSVKTLETGKSCRNVIMGVRSTTGELYWVNINTSPLFIEKETKPYAVIITFSDVTVQKAIQQALREAEANLRAVLASSPVALMVFDQDMCILYSNSAADDLFKNEYTINVKTRCGEFVRCINITSVEQRCGYSPACSECPLFNAIKKTIDIEATKKDEFDGDMLLTREPPREPIWLHYRSRPIYLNSQKCVIISLDDITDRIHMEEALRQSEERYRVIFENTGQAIGIVKNGKIVFANPKLEEMIGYSADEFKSLGNFELSHPDDREMIKRNTEKLLTGEENIVRYQLRVFDRYGNMKWLDRAFTRFNWEGETAFIAIDTDITLLKQTEEELKKQRDFATGLVETAQTIVVVLDPEGKVSYINPYMEHISGWKLEEVVGKDWFDLFLHERNREKTRSLFIKAINDIQTAGNVDSLISRDGRELLIEWYDKTLKDNNGQVIGLLATGQDVTQKRQAEQVLRENEEKFRLIFNKASDMILLLEMTPDNQIGKIMQVNDMACRILGYGRDELVGTDQVILSSRSEWRRMNKEIIPELLRGSNVNFDTVVLTKTGTKIETENSANILEQNGQKMILLLSRDVSKRKREEAELRRSRKELRDLSIRLLNIREEERTNLARELHDELGQALTALKIDLSFLSRNISADREDLAKKASSMRALLDASTNVVRRISTELRPGLLDDIGLAAAMEWQLGEFSARTGIKYKLNDRLEDVPVNKKLETALFRIFQEHLTNIARHSQATKVTTSILNKDGTIEMRIRDNGRGINPEEISDSRSLGLIGMRERAAAINGELVIKGIRGRGTYIMVRIPLEGGTKSD